MKEQFQYPAVIQSIANIRDDLKLFAQRSDLPASELRQITLIIEEMFSKIVRNAFQENDSQKLDISVIKLEEEIIIDIQYAGHLFNPVENSQNNLADPASIEDGEMGLSLIQAFCDSIEYKAKGNMNSLIIKKVIRGQAENQQT